MAFRLIKRIFLLYGYRTNAITLVFIIRKILENASFAALIEFADDSITEVLGNTLTAKLSVKIAEGIGNGILVLRLGNVIIQSARPFTYDGSVGSYKQMSKLFITDIKRDYLNERNIFQHQTCYYRCNRQFPRCYRYSYATSRWICFIFVTKIMQLKRNTPRG